MAVLLFSTAREAVAAHSNNDFVYLGTRNVSSNYVKVYFPNGKLFKMRHRYKNAAKDDMISGTLTI